MKRLSVAALIALAGCNATPRPALQGDEAALRSAVAAYDSAWLAKDSLGVARHLAGEYTYFTSTGGISSLSESYGFLRDTTYRLTRSERSEVSVTMTGPVGRVSSRWIGVGEYQGAAVRDDQTCGQIWIWRDGRWQLFSEHCVNRVPSP